MRRSSDSSPSVSSAQSEGSSIRFSQTLDTDMMYAAVPLEKAGEIIAIVRIALPLEQIERNIGQLQRAILTAALIASAAAVVVAAMAVPRKASARISPPARPARPRPSETTPA